MWFADVVVDVPWFIASRGQLGEPRARALPNVYDPDLKIEMLLYGDDEAIRHLQVMASGAADAVSGGAAEGERPTS